MNNALKSIAIVIMVGVIAGSASAAEWGSLKGRIVVDGFTYR